MEEKDNTISTTERTNKEKEEGEKNINKEKDVNQESLEDEKIINSLKQINIDTNDYLSLVNDLIDFSFKIKSIKNISAFLTFENIDILKKLSSKDNIKINLILTKIYMNIMNNESLYSIYLSVLNEDNINFLIKIIEECISLIEKLNTFVFDQDQYKFKVKTFSFIKCLYYNLKNKITNDITLRKLMDWIDSFPMQFFSETFNQLNQEKELFEIWKEEDQDKINTFEDRFAQINNYYEQFDMFRKFVETNSGVVKYDSFGGEEEKDEEEKKEEEKKQEIDPSKIDFYNQYGLLILKFCKYHNYVFLNKENKDAENKEKKEGEDENENVRVVFLLDKIKQIDDEENKEEEKEEPKEDEDKKEEKKEEEKTEETKKKEEEKKEETNKNEPEKNGKDKGNQKIRNIMDGKLFLSITDSKEYNELIKKEINNYLKATISIGEDEKIKNLRDQMSYYLSILDTDSYVPLYLTDFSKITISDNFTPSFLTNVPAGKTNELYVETKMNETMLVFIEFSLEDKSKDITFEVNKYEISTNTFKPIFKEERIEDTFKFFILCKGYSLYQIVFNNYYSWFTSKDINYRIGILKLINKEKKEFDFEQNDEEEKNNNHSPKEEKEEKDNEDKFYCYFNGKNVCFNKNDINKKIKDFDSKKEDEEVINIPVLLYLNHLRIVSFEKGEIKFKEKADEDENFIPKHLFDYTIIEYIKKTLKIKPAEAKNKKFIISLFSQNRDLSSLYKEVDDQIKALGASTINNSINDYETLEYLEKVGFYPSEILQGYNVQYKLYDLCEQSLIYHLYLSNLKNEAPQKSVLFILFDKLVVNAAVFNEGAIFTKLKGKKEKGPNWKSSYFSNINISDENAILDFLENANDTFEGIDLVLSCVDQNEEQQNKLKELFDKIEKHCQEKISPPVKVIVYNQNEIANNVFNYINLFYEK